VTETKAIPRLGGGNVYFNLQVNNQSNEVVMKGNWNVLMMSKPA
jgi:hypothetical protein